MLEKRQHDATRVEEIKKGIEKYKELKGRIDGLRADRNRFSKEIGQLMGQKKTTEAEKKKAEVKDLGESLDKLEEEYQKLEEEFRHEVLLLPNWVAEDVPVGKDESENVQQKSWGQKPSFNFKPLPHFEIGEKTGIINFERGVKLAGSRFYAYYGLAARLERALVAFMLDQARSNGYTEVFVPMLVNDASMQGTGQFPKFAGEFYRLDADGLNLIPTSEVPLVNLYRDDILNEAELPLALTAATSCFRREAGAAGKDTRGLVRVHQFQKVELVQICKPADSEKIHATMVEHVESVLQKLGLHYRIMLLCSGDMGAAAAKTCDFEVWMPGLDRYLEISSVSNCLDYQGRRAMIRFRPEGPKEKPQIVHTLNGSGVAAGRAMAAIMENYQQEDGSFSIPDCLQKYLA
jgi:seryl-tRNA synthetase